MSLSLPAVQLHLQTSFGCCISGCCCCVCKFQSQAGTFFLAGSSDFSVISSQSSICWSSTLRGLLSQLAPTVVEPSSSQATSRVVASKDIVCGAGPEGGGHRSCPPQAPGCGLDGEAPSAAHVGGGGTVEPGSHIAGCNGAGVDGARPPHEDGTAGEAGMASLLKVGEPAFQEGGPTGAGDAGPLHGQTGPGEQVAGQAGGCSESCPAGPQLLGGADGEDGTAVQVGGRGSTGDPGAPHAGGGTGLVAMIGPGLCAATRPGLVAVAGMGAVLKMFGEPPA